MSAILAKFLAWKAMQQKRAEPKKPGGARYKNIYRKEEIIRRLQSGESTKSIAADIGSNYQHLTKMVRSWGATVWLTHEQIKTLNGRSDNTTTEDQGSRACPVRDCDGGNCCSDGAGPAAACTSPESACDCQLPPAGERDEESNSRLDR